MPQSFDCAQVGDPIPGRTVGPLTRMDFARFSVASDDPNKVHVDERVAQAAGFPSVIGSGGIVTGLIIDVISNWCGLERVRKAKIRMFMPLVPDTVLHASGEVEARQQDGSMTVRATVVDDADNRVGTGEFLIARTNGVS